MKEIIKKILEKWLCKHNWERYFRTEFRNSPSEKIPGGRIDTLICKKCGYIKKITLG